MTKATQPKVLSFTALQNDEHMSDAMTTKDRSMTIKKATEMFADWSRFKVARLHLFAHNQQTSSTHKHDHEFALCRKYFTHFTMTLLNWQIKNWLALSHLFLTLFIWMQPDERLFTDLHS